MSIWKRAGKAFLVWLVTMFAPLAIATLIGFNAGHRQGFERGSHAMESAIFAAWDRMAKVEAVK